MQLAIRPKVALILRCYLFEAAPTKKSFVRSVGLDTKIIDIFWVSNIIGEQSSTNKNKGWSVIRFLRIYKNAIWKILHCDREAVNFIIARNPVIFE